MLPATGCRAPCQRCKLPYKIREDGLVLVHDKTYVPDDPGIHLLILKRKHDHVLAGHPGITKTCQLIKRSCYWPKANQSSQITSSCLTCVRNKSRRQRPHGPLHTAGKVIRNRLQVACHRCTAVIRLQMRCLQAPAQIEILAGGRFPFGLAPANILFASKLQLYICDMPPAPGCRSLCPR